MQAESWLGLAFFVLFAAYGFSNVYIIVFLRKHGSFTLDLGGFLSVYAGDVKNYRKLNRMFVDACRERGASPGFTTLVSFTHLGAPVLVLALIPTIVVLGVLFPL